MNLNRYNLCKGDLIGCLEGMPVRVVEQMLDAQVAQGNTPNIKILQNKVDTPARFGGFDWNKTPQGVAYWSKIINKRDFSDVPGYCPEEKVEVFRPEPFSRVLGVSITGKTTKEYIFIGYIPGAKYPNMVCTPNAFEAYKKGIKPLDITMVKGISPAPPQKIRLTLKDISEGKGVGIDPNLIEIVK